MEHDFTREDDSNEVLKRLTPSVVPPNDGHRGRPSNEDRARIQRYNVAIWRLIHGKGSMIREIAVLTGLTERAVARRSQKAEKAFPPDKLASESEGLTADESRYLSRLYGRSKDPEVRSFIDSLRNPSPN